VDAEAQWTKAETVTHWTDSYNITWDTPSRHSAESMPCGGGDIGLNVWVEEGDILFYLQRSGSLAETNEYLKLGRVRLQLDPNPWAKPGAAFTQTLKLREGYVQITGADVTVRLWVEVHRPIVRVEIDAKKPVEATAVYENWRLEEELLTNDTRRHASFDLNAYPGEVRLGPDEVTHADRGVLFYHRNPPANWLRNLLIEQQGLEAYRDQIPDDLSNRTFGGLMTGEGFEAAGCTAGRYQTRDYKGWVLRSSKPANTHHLRLVTHIAQAELLTDWQRELDALAAESASDIDTARAKTLAWWDAFWQRSHIVIHPDQPRPDDRAWRIARNYNLFRYQLGCNAFGQYPSKFNGGSFTFDANLVDIDRPSDNWQQHGPDWRQWGGGVLHRPEPAPALLADAQGRRRRRHPAQFELYRKSLPGAQARVKSQLRPRWRSITASTSALPVSPSAWATAGQAADAQSGRGTAPRRPARRPTPEYGDPVEKGMMANRAISLSLGIAARTRLHDARVPPLHRSRHLPVSPVHRERDGVLRRALPQAPEDAQRPRSGRRRPPRPLSPSKACESFRGATNPADLIAGLEACLEALLEIGGPGLQLRDKAYYRSFAKSLPYSYGRDKRPPRHQARPGAGRNTATPSCRSSTRCSPSTALRSAGMTCRCSSTPTDSASSARAMWSVGTRTASSSPAWA
jgi:hypothetical protein